MSDFPTYKLEKSSLQKWLVIQTYKGIESVKFVHSYVAGCMWMSQQVSYKATTDFDYQILNRTKEHIVVVEEPKVAPMSLIKNRIKTPKIITKPVKESNGSKKELQKLRDKQGTQDKEVIRLPITNYPADSGIQQSSSSHWYENWVRDFLSRKV